MVNDKSTLYFSRDKILSLLGRLPSLRLCAVDPNSPRGQIWPEANFKLSKEDMWCGSEARQGYGETR
jgi:hypothetical protein